MHASLVRMSFAKIAIIDVVRHSVRSHIPEAVAPRRKINTSQASCTQRCTACACTEVTFYYKWKCDTGVIGKW